MTFLSVIKILIALLAVPSAMGLILCRKNESKALLLVFGYIVTWSFVFLISVPLILLNLPFRLLYHCWIVGSIVLSLWGIVIYYFSKRKKAVAEKKGMTRSEIIYLGLFLGLVFFQLYKSVFYAYEDGDDAFYVSLANIIDDESAMYRTEPYLGLPSGVNYRYAIAPFPMWIAVIARFTGVNASAISHSIIPIFLIIATYTVFYEIGNLLFDGNREKNYMFLTLVAVYEMFSAVSTSTSGRFLLTRARQGKEALANIILPLLFCELFRIIKNECAIRFMDWLILFLVCIAAALTSMFGNVLAPIMIAAMCLYLLIVKKTFKKAVLTATVVLPNLLTVLLYMKLS